LDDYEEGTWTPSSVVSATGTITSYSVSAATYTKIGRQVTVNIVISITNAGTGAGFLDVALPFTSGSTSVGSGRENSLTGNMLQTLVSATGTTMGVGEYDNSTAIATGATCRMTLTYFV
jgi:hypothetical protein